MESIYDTKTIITESDVEQKVLYKLLTTPPPNGLGYNDSEVPVFVKLLVAFFHNCFIQKEVHSFKPLY